MYKKAWPLEKNLTLMEDEKGNHFDPQLVDLFCENLDIFLQIHDEFHDDTMLMVPKMMTMKKYLTVLLALFSPTLFAGKADVIGVNVRCDNSCAFSVTLKHADSGWDHYANEWTVVAPDGSILGTRVLLHPHVNEQPFTRSLSGVKIPANIKQVTIRAKDSVHGFGGIEKQVKLP